MPIRVNEAHSTSGMLMGAAPPPEREAVTNMQQVFARQLSTLGREQYEAHIQELTRSVEEQAARLLERMDLSEFQRYREKVSGLLHETVSNAFHYHKMGGFDARGRHRIMAMVRTVNEELEQMASEFLEDQADNLRVLAHIDDIRGLLVDIFL